MTTTDDRTRTSCLIWEDPPRSRHRAGHDVRRPPATDPVYQRCADELRAHPGRWARIAQFTSRMDAAGEANRIASGREGAFLPIEHFQFTSRTGRIYARYLGDPR
jgi:hypothetical protein